MVFEAIVNGIIFLIFFSACSLLIYRGATEFCILIFYLATLPKVFARSKGVFVVVVVESLVFF
jgi:hypothetical protein